MRKFDYNFLADEIPSNIAGTSDIISDLRAKEGFRKLQYEDAFDKLREKAIIESVRGSNAIEGIVTTDDRIRAIVEGNKPVTHDELEISGYKDALNLIHTSHEDIDVTEETILTFHRYIQNETNPREAGRYKDRDNFIMEYASDGRRKIRFKPTSAKETDAAMEQLLLAYYDARQNTAISQLFLIPCFIVDFLCIHPFIDGNGRVSRLLNVLMLYLSGHDIVRYISLEGLTDQYKGNYYETLRQSSKGWHENKNSYIPFLTFSMQILYKCYKKLDDSFMDIALKKAKKSERVEAVLMNTIVPISKSEIIEKLPDISVKTVELVLSKMLKDEKIKKIGTYRDARYVRR